MILTIELDNKSLIVIYSLTNVKTDDKTLGLNIR